MRHRRIGRPLLTHVKPRMSCDPRPTDPTISAARRPRLRDERGFTVIEVLAASIVLIVGLTAMLGMLIVGNHATAANRERQAATSLARELIEDTRTLAYTQLVQSSMASTLQPMVSGSTVSGQTLQVTRSIYTFNVTFTECSLDDRIDGYGSHTSAPLRGGSWCSDVAASGSTDSNPDDYKRVSVTVTPANGSTVSQVQQTALIYNQPANGHGR
jgi:Tfp pilus assembly protein PilV